MPVRSQQNKSTACLRQEIWLPNGLGGAFEEQLNKLPDTYEYERRDTATYKRRTLESWVVYTFELDIEADAEPIIACAEKVQARYQKEVRYRHYPFHRTGEPLLIIGDLE